MKKIATLLLAISITAGLSAFEWGGQIGDDTTFSGNKASDLNLTQTNDVSLWITTPLNADNTLKLSAEGLYQFKYEQEPDEITHSVNLNLLKLSYNKALEQGTLSLSAGRFIISDATGLVFSQASDGLYLTYSTSKFSAGVYGGYTGLLNANLVSIITPEDTEWEDDDNQFYTLAAKYVPFGATFTLPNAFANQSLTVQAWGFADLNDDDFNRFYADAGLSGYLTTKLYYNLVTSFGTKNFENATNLSKLSVNYFLKDFWILNFGGVYASGDNGAFEPFVGFTSQTADLSFYEPEYSGILKFTAGTTVNIKNQALATATAGLVFDVSGADYDGADEYKGFQWQVDLMWSIFSDLNVGCSAYQFIADNSDNDKLSFSLNARLNF